MSCRPRIAIACFLIAFLTLAGCYPTQPMYLRESGDLSYYLEQATSIDYPDVQTARLEEVAQSRPPITVIDPDFDSFYDLTLEECVSISLQNSKVIRGYGTPNLAGTRVSPGIDTLTTGPAGSGTFYNVAIRETEPGFLGSAGNLASPSSLTTNTGLDANQGVEAALADFDAQFSSNLFWSRSDEPRNTVAPFDRTAFRQDQVTFQNQIAKKTAEGTQLFVRNSTVYTNNNIPLSTDLVNPGFQILPSWWRMAMEVEARQPLMRGRGAFINRMPIIISRIGTDQELANLEAQLQNMVTNVEIRYWDLQAGYRFLETAKAGRDAALQTWRIIRNQYDAGADVNIQQVAQASEQYHFFDEQVVDAYNTLLSAESSLRWLMGIAATDGQVIRPIDEPTIAPFEFDWCESLDEALIYRPELRLERWELKKKELALAYAKNGLLPEVNATALYRWLGLGDSLVAYGDNVPNFPLAGSGATNGLLESRFQEFQFGAEFKANVGFRRELANVRNAQLKLAREHARMEDLELDVSRELSDAIRAMAANRRVMQIAFNRWAATSVEEKHFKDLIEAGIKTLDIALDAQRRRAQAEFAFYAALAEYNKTIALVHRRKGTILAYNGVDFAEGAWPGKAYQDASENARRRSASRQVNYGWTRPEVISQGPIWPTANQSGSVDHLFQSETEMEPNPAEPYYIQGDEIVPDADALPGTQIHGQELPSIDQYEPLGSKINSDSNVRQTSFETLGATNTVPSRDGSDRIPVQIAPSAPKRDEATAPPVTNVRVPTVSAHVDWEKFGLQNPSGASTGTNAKIKQSDEN